MNPYKDQFLLDPNIVYLNHGSYGATPRPVFDVYQAWQRRLEWDPVDFLHNQLPPLLKDARTVLGRHLNASADDLVYIPNTTFGINVIAHSLTLQPGDEVLTTDHEYGSVNNIWVYLCHKRGVSYIRRPVAFPAVSAETMLEEIWAGVTPRTKLILISHITSATALRLPVEALCRRARDAGILTLIDGAHAPGHIPLDLSELAADFYVGNCHKWLCSPKGAAFLYTKRECQHLIEPIVIGWGWGETRKPSTETDYIDSLQLQGTDDLSAYLSVPAAIDFQAQHDWVTVRENCHHLLHSALQQVEALTGLPHCYPLKQRLYEQMAVFELPPVDLNGLVERLYKKHRIQIPGMAWNGRQFLRISLQAYNSQEDIDALCAALHEELPAARH